MRAQPLYMAFIPALILSACELMPASEHVDGAVSYGSVLTVSTVDELMATQSATKKGNVLVLIQDGTYELSAPLYLTGDRLCFRSESGMRDSVIILGKGMGGSVASVFQVAGQDFRLQDLSVGQVSKHCVQVHGEKDADGFFACNVRFFDSGEQLLKVSYSAITPDIHADRGVVVDCLFEFKAGHSYQAYSGGIDAHRARDWTISGNSFRGIRAADGGLTEGAIHFWDGSHGTLVDSNSIIDCDRGVLFGLDASPHTGGRISNNFIHVVKDTGIYLCDASGALVANNTVFIDSPYGNAIEYRFTTTGSYIANNLCNKAVRSRDGAVATVERNITSALGSWFLGAASGNLHVKEAYRLEVQDRGLGFPEFSHDIDGQDRTGAFDIGADE